DTVTACPAVGMPTYQSCGNDPTRVFPSGELGFDGFGVMLAGGAPDGVIWYWSLNTALPRAKLLPLVRAANPSFHCEETPASSVAVPKSSFTSMYGIASPKLSNTCSHVSDRYPYFPAGLWSVPSSFRWSGALTSKVMSRRVSDFAPGARCLIWIVTSSCFLLGPIACTAALSRSWPVNVAPPPANETLSEPAVILSANPPLPRLESGTSLEEGYSGASFGEPPLNHHRPPLGTKLR